MPNGPERDFADPDDFGELLSLSDVAKLLGIHVGTAQRYAREGIIPSHKFPSGRRYYVLKSELLEHIATLPHDPADEQPVRLPRPQHGEQ